MNELPKYYTVLFHAATDTIALIDEMNFGAARKTLVIVSTVENKQSVTFLPNLVD